MGERTVPSFYAVIPATVRYDKGLTPLARLLYGEITALCSVEGYCWAGNDYFAKLYDVDESTVRRWIQSLRDGGYISVELNNTGHGFPRKLRILEGGAQKCAGEGAQKCAGGAGKNAPHITTPGVVGSESEDSDADARLVIPEAIPADIRSVYYVHLAITGRGLTVAEVRAVAEVLKKHYLARLLDAMGKLRGRADIESPVLYAASILERQPGKGRRAVKDGDYGEMPEGNVFETAGEVAQ